MAGEPEVLMEFSGAGGSGSVLLNRASKLNSLNLNMIRLLHGVVDELDRRAGQLGCMVMSGAGGKAFCAGGDVAEIRAEGMAGGTLPADFFMDEYAVVFRLASLFERTGCCLVSLWDGITMGGGVGLSVHGPIRIVTEKTVFAMPEMAIGLFPDVGATQKLGRLPIGGAVGMYLGATGTRLNAWDCLKSGLATHFVPSAAIPRLRELLTSAFSGNVTGPAGLAACEAAIREAAAGAEPSDKGAALTKENVEVIDRCFSAATLEEIMTRLAAESGDFAAKTLTTMKQSCSPTSCKVTIRGIREHSAKDVSLGHCLQVEYRLAVRFTTRPQPHSDFWEGIRAVLVDKDRKQNWSPNWDELAKIDDKALDLYFSPLGPEYSRGELLVDHLTAWSEAERKPFVEPVLRAKL